MEILQSEAPPNPLFKPTEPASQLVVFCHLGGQSVMKVIQYNLTF